MIKRFPAKKIFVYSRQVGFTLAEIMKVALIVSIISAFSIGYFQQYNEKSNLTIAQNMLNIYAQELVAFQLKSGRLPENNQEYEIFLQQLRFDPNKDPQYRNYFQIIPDFSKNYLLAIPQQKHRYNSYAKMNLNDFSVEVCQNATQKLQGKGDICRKTITANRLNQ